jgi:hypothetical protein
MQEKALLVFLKLNQAEQDREESEKLNIINPRETAQMKPIILETTAYRPLFTGTIFLALARRAIKNEINRTIFPVNQVVEIANLKFRSVSDQIP